MGRPVRNWHWIRWSEQSAQTFPAFRRPVGQDGDPYFCPHEGYGVERQFSQRLRRHRSTVRPSSSDRRQTLEGAGRAVRAKLGSGHHGRPLLDAPVAQQRPDHVCLLAAKGKRRSQATALRGCGA